jgi:hypothetical protein
MRRDTLVVCETCGRKVVRQMRLQRYCSAQCKEGARKRSRKGYLSGDTGAPATPIKKARIFNDLQWAKRQSSSPILGPSRVVETECFARFGWRQVVSPHGVEAMVTRFRAK